MCDAVLIELNCEAVLKLQGPLHYICMAKNGQLQLVQRCIRGDDEFPCADLR